MKLKITGDIETLRQWQAESRGSLQKGKNS